MGVLLAKEKIVWASLFVIFLGILLDGNNHLLALPQEKIDKAVNWLQLVLTNKKVLVKDVERLTGLLNFLNKAIVLGWAFTRCMYAKIVGKTKGLKQHHHIYLDQEFTADCIVWLKLLKGNLSGTLSLSLDSTPSVVYRPFLDQDKCLRAEDIGFFTDSSANATLGFGGICQQQWFYGQWEPGYINKYKHSIEYLELYAVCIGAFIWSKRLENQRILIHCDNMAVVSMVNKTTSSSKRCMHLIRLLVLRSMQFNFRLFASYVSTKSNDLADSLSWLQWKHFKALGGSKMDKLPCVLPTELWPASAIWDGFSKASWF